MTEKKCPFCGLQFGALGCSTYISEDKTEENRSPECYERQISHLQAALLSVLSHGETFDIFRDDIGQVIKREAYKVLEALNA